MPIIMLAVTLISVPAPAKAVRAAAPTHLVCGDWQASSIGGSYKVCENVKGAK